MLQVVKSKNGNSVKSTRKVTKTGEKTVHNEIEMHVRKIRTLIDKLPPRDRQDYFSGLLNHILTDTRTTTTQSKKGKDNNKLSKNELVLLNELSTKMEELYRTMDYNPYL